MEFDDFPMSYSPSSDDYQNLFTNDCNFIGDEVNCINPDEFLNLDEFEIKNESSSPSPPDHRSTYQNCSPPQLTPPISPQPSSIVIDSSLYQKVRIIPINELIPQRENFASKKVINIVPKPIDMKTSSSDSDSNINPKTAQGSVNKALIRQQRLIRNRESAIMSRNKKKEYVQTLEAQNMELKKENSFLKAENSQLKERLRSYGVMTCRGAKTISKSLPTKNATLLLAVLFMVGFNIVPFGNLLFKSPIKDPMGLKQFNARHLLFDENSTNFGNETFTNETQEIYYNQTEDIRKVNIDNIRRWIPEPDIFNVSQLKEDFKFNPDPLQEKLAKMYEKSREQSQKRLKKKRAPKKKTVVGPMQLYDSKLNIIKLNEFFDEFDRKDDTFYVFSFKSDHLLLPAIDNSSQIKMNLIMPRGKASSTNDKITMMQIETLIINTSFIQLTEKSIPENFLKPAVNASSCNEAPSFTVDRKLKRNLNDSAEDFQPLRSRAIKSRLEFNAIDLLKANSKK